MLLYPDTNIFLHYRRLDEIDWRALVDAEGPTIAVAQVVIRELEHHRHHLPVKRIRRRAGDIVSFLHGLLSQGMQDGLPVAVRDGVLLDFQRGEPQFDFAGAGLVESVNDDRIAATVLTLRVDDSQEKGRYAYDAFGLRRTKDADGNITVYHYDEAGNLLLETDDAAEVQKVYVWADATPVAQVAVVTTTTGHGHNQQTVVTETLTYLHVDHLNTPRWGTDDAGALMWRWQSDGFAEALLDEDVDGDGTNVVVDLRFPGQVYDAESRLHYNRFRYYDPSIGRYISADPIGQAGGSNVFLYSANSPTAYSDPWGLDIWTEGPSGGEVGFHQSVNVGDPYGAYDSYSFAAQIYLGDLFGGTGIVYRERDKGGPIDRYADTNAAQDAAARQALEDLVGDRGFYHPFNQCISFSNEQFDGLLEALGATEGVAPPREPAPRTPSAYARDGLAAFLSGYLATRSTSSTTSD